LAFSGPPPYLLHEDWIETEWNQPAPHAFPDGSSVTVYTYPDEVAAQEGADAVCKAVPRERTESEPGMTRYTRRDNGLRGLGLALGPGVLQMEADDDSRATARLASLPFVGENPEKGPLMILFTRHLPLALPGIMGYVLLWFAFLFRGGAW